MAEIKERFFIKMLPEVVYCGTIFTYNQKSDRTIFVE
jgi:hypothetical protein